MTLIKVGIPQIERNPRRLCRTRANCRVYFFPYSVCDVSYGRQILKYSGLHPRDPVPLQTRSLIGERNSRIFNTNTTPNPVDNRRYRS